MLIVFEKNINTIVVQTSIRFAPYINKAQKTPKSDMNHKKIFKRTSPIYKETPTGQNMTSLLDDFFHLSVQLVVLSSVMLQKNFHF